MKMNKLRKMDIPTIRKFLNSHKHLTILALLLGIGFVFAFFNYENRYTLGDEPVREAIIGIEGARSFQAPLMGAFSSAGQFTWGPWFYYQMILSNLIVPSFYSPWIYLGIAYLASIIVLYRIGVDLKSKAFGVILATLGTFSPALISGATNLTFPNLITFFSLLSILLFIKIIKGNVSYWWGLAFGIILGICVNIHYQAASLLILPLIMLVYKKKKIYYFLSFLIGFSFTFLPTLLFELTNNWFNTRNIIYYFLHGKDAIYVPNRWLFYIRDFWPGFWSDVIGTPHLLGLIFMISVALVLLYEAYKRKLSIPVLLLAIAFFINFFLLRYYWGERLYIYFTFMRPFVLIFTGYVIYFLYRNSKYGRLFSVGILTLLLIIISQNSFTKLESNDFNKKMYARVELIKDKYPGKKFAVYNCNKVSTGNDQAVAKSILFILEKERLIDKYGVKIGAEKERCIKRGIENKTITEEDLVFSDPVKYPMIGKTGMYDFSEANDEILKKAGWEELTFEKIYNSTVKWWYRELP